ncbi:MAG: hypothetical protein LBD92_02560 [Oscillospiraceae bacterium]|jgi:hypothetical protein|nr:hypothetical protein [Oscillospiraceae bacterium]
MYKKTVNIILVIIISLSLSVSVFAQGSSLTDNQTSSEYSISDFSNFEETVDMSGEVVGTSEETVEFFVEDAYGNVTRGVVVVTSTVIRSGNTTSCSVELYWSGTDLYNAWRLDSCTVDDGGWLFPTVYGTCGAKTNYVTGATSGSTTTFAYVAIPTNVTQARVSYTGLQGYNMNSGSWVSIAGGGVMGDIN